MSEKQKQILETFEKVIPHLSELEKEKLLAFGEDLSFAVKAGRFGPARADAGTSLQTGQLWQ